MTAKVVITPLTGGPVNRSWAWTSASTTVEATAVSQRALEQSISLHPCNQRTRRGRGLQRPSPQPLVSLANQPFTTAATTPTAPLNLTALPGDGRVTLTWDAPDSNGGRAIDTYDYRYSSDGGDNWTDWTEVPDSGPAGMNHSRYRVMGLTNGTTYTFELRAVTTVDDDGAAAQTTGMPRAPGAIAVMIESDPASPVAEDVGTVTITVTAANRTATAPENGIGLTVTTMDGTAVAGEDFTALSETVTFAVTDFTLVAAGTHYEVSKDLTLTITDNDIDEDDETFAIQLAASAESADEVTLGAGITVTITDDDDVPGTPTLSAEAGDQEVTLKWTAPNPGTSTIDGYDYRVSDDAGQNWDPDWTAISDSAAGGANASSYTVTMHSSSTLANSVAYTFEVRARSAAGEGPEAQATTTPGEVCGRTKKIANAIVAASPVSGCGDVTTIHLAAITELDLNSQDVFSLRAGDFAGLTALEKLGLFAASLPELPAGIFAGLSTLTELNLGDNTFTALPQGIFSDLSALSKLYLGQNNFTTLPEDTFANVPTLTLLALDSNRISQLPENLFKGLTALTALNLSGNPVEPLPLTVGLEKIGEDGFRARVREGAPFDIEVSLTIMGGTIDGGASSLTISTGSVQSSTLQVTRTTNSTDAVTVDIGTLPDRPTDENIHGVRNHRGYELTKSPDVPLDVLAALMSTAVTLTIDPASPLAEDVGTATVTVAAATNTAAAPTEVIEVTVATADGTATAGEDFEALSETVSFAIADFTLVTAGTHYEASKDVTLTITNDPVDEEDETFAIQLAVSGTPANEVTVAADTTVTITDDDDLPGAPALTARGGYEEATLEWTAPANEGTSTIEAYGYRVSTDTTAPYTWDPDWTAIPDSGAGGTNETSYTVTMHAGAALVNATTYTFEVRARSAAGSSEGAQATATPNEVCGRSQQVREAIIAATPATACADVTAAHLAAITGLDLRGRTIRELTSGDFAGLTGLLNLKMSRVRVTTLPDGIFTGLTSLTGLSIGEGDITTLRANVFDNLTALRTLEFFLNKLTELPAGIFDNLTSLRVLSLGDNALTTLRAADVFANNAALEELGIQANQLTGLPGSIFSTTPRLRQLNAHTNHLNALPDGLFSGLSEERSCTLHTYGCTTTLEVHSD